MSLTSSLGYTPIYQISKGGSDITGQFNDRTLIIQVESLDGGGQGDRLNITLDDRDWTINSPVTDGDNKATLDVYLGYKETALYEQGNFEINQTTYSFPPKVMQLMGLSNGFTNASKSPLITSFDGKTVGDIVSAIAQSAGVTANVDATTGQNQIKYLNQHSSSIHLLQELERRYNGLAKFENGMLSFTPRGTGQTASNATLTPFTLVPEDFANCSVTEHSRHSYSQVKASYWDPTQHKLVWLNNSNTASGQSSVPDMIKRAFNTKDEAQAAADAQMDASNRTLSQGTCTLAKGDPSIRAGTTFTILGTREGIDGEWVIRKATHSFTKAEGIVTTLEFYSNGSSGSGDPEAAPASQNSDTDGITSTPLGQGGIGHA